MRCVAKVWPWAGSRPKSARPAAASGMIPSLHPRIADASVLKAAIDGLAAFLQGAQKLLAILALV
jgi:hypothetical protein